MPNTPDGFALIFSLCDTLNSLARNDLAPEAAGRL
jgi:hypothetical protein